MKLKWTRSVVWLISFHLPSNGFRIETWILGAYMLYIHIFICRCEFEPRRTGIRIRGGGMYLSRDRYNEYVTCSHLKFQLFSAQLTSLAHPLYLLLQRFLVYLSCMSRVLCWTTSTLEVMTWMNSQARSPWTLFRPWHRYDSGSICFLLSTSLEMTSVDDEY